MIHGFVLGVALDMKSVMTNMSIVRSVANTLI